MRTRVRVLKPGFLTTVQDLGRFGYQRFGMPVSGAMDAFACRAANRLVGNPDSAAVLEMTIKGADLLFDGDTVIALTGADFSMILDGAPLPFWTAVYVSAGAVLTFAGRRRGARAYLALEGGLDVPLVLGSRATHVRSGTGGLEGRALRTGDVLEARSRLRRRPSGGNVCPASARPAYSPHPTLRVLRGRDVSTLAHQALEILVASRFIVSPQSDRMGYRLLGPSLTDAAELHLLSEATPTGTIQVPPDHQPILLMADHATTGGYPKVATIVSADLPLAAQLVPGDTVTFAVATVAEAHALMRRQEAWLQAIVGGKQRRQARAKATRRSYK